MKLKPSTIVAAACLIVAHRAVAQTNQVRTNISRAKPVLPSKVTLDDGSTYNSVKLIRVEPDGLFVKYAPCRGGEGMAKLKFADLPESITKQFNYSPLEAALHEKGKGDASSQWAAWQATQEDIASRVRREREKENTAWRIHVDAMELQRVQAEAKKKQAEADRAKADAEKMRAMNPPQVNVINQNQNVNANSLGYGWY